MIYWTMLNQFFRPELNRAEEQIARQLLGVNEVMDEAKKDAPDRFYTIEYKQLCETPRDCLKEIVNWLKNTAGVVDYDIKSIPSSFPFSTGLKVSKKQYCSLKSEIKTLTS